VDEGEKIGVGPTEALSLRVSVATLVRVKFPHPDNGEPLLALEHKATVFSKENLPQLIVKAQPFGGAVRFINLGNFQKIVSKFQFDSERAQAEGDFRIFIHPEDWAAVRDYCLENFSGKSNQDLETDPIRELVEEFEDTLGTTLQPGQYRVRVLKTVVENVPVRTKNVHAFDQKTVRVYRIFEGIIQDPALGQSMAANSQRHPRETLEKLARKNSAQGRPGRANAMWVAPLQAVHEAYKALPPPRRHQPLPFMNTLLDGNVPAILDDLDVPNYEVLQSPKR
jgi:hypothetical protein